MTGWNLGRLGKLTLVVLLLVSSLFGMVGFTAVPTVDDGSTQTENPAVTTVPAAEPTPAPDVTPTPDTEPIPEPTVVPTAEPDTEPTPTAEPIATPEPTAEPTPMPEPTPDAESEISVTLHIIPAPDAAEECVPFTVPAGSSLDLIVNDSVLYSLTGGADTYSAETGTEQTETETWEWYTLDTEGGKVPYDLSTPITAPLDVYAARGIATTALVTKAVKFYIALNGAWLELSDKTTTVSVAASFPGGGERYYIKYSDLVNIYKDYDGDITGRPYNGELFFPHRDDNSPSKVWADVAPMKATDGSDDYWIPLGGTTGVTGRPTYYVYYTPGNVSDNESYFKDSKELSDTTFLTENSFYTVEINGNGKVKEQADYANTLYFFSGGNAVLELPALNEASAEWVVHNIDGGALKTTACTLIKDDASSTTMVQMKNITEHVVLSAKGDDYEIVYNANVTKEYLSSSFPKDNQSVIVNGSVKGMTEYTVMSPKIEDHRVLAPDSDRASVIISNNDKPRTIFYTFKYWKIDGSDVIVAPGATLTPERLAEYTAGNDIVTLSAVWTAFEETENGADKLISTANFYVCYDCEIAGNFGSGYTPPTEQKNFTTSVYSTRVFGTTSSENTDKGFTVVNVPDADNAASVDSTIRSLSRMPVSGLTLEGVPSDETVLSALRAGNEKVHVGGVEIQHEYLTSDHFSVRWYVFKYEHSDGYHVDGVLVAKAARLIVTKTFTGSTEVINATKQQDFKINVVHGSSTGSGGSNAVVVVPDYTLCLKPEGNTSLAKDETGYKSYDPVTDTYTWVLDGYQNQKYTITEEGGGIPDEYAGEYSQTARYTVRNPNQQTVTPVSGWNSYNDAGVTVTVAAYANDIPDEAVQTVALENMYVKTGTLTVAKRDSVTGHGIAGVEFELSMNDPPEGTTFQLYHKPGSSQYSSDSQDDGYTDVAADNVVVTGGNGYFYLKLEGGRTYTLTERVPLGYNGAVSVTFAVDADGTITNVSETCIKDSAGNDIKLPDGAAWATLDDSKTVLSIDNLSHVLTEVKVQSTWVGAYTDEEKPIIVQLWRGGAPMVGGDYTVELNVDGEWSYVWPNLPLFADGELAEYTVRVMYIGDTAYDGNIPGISDGYENYDITFDDNLYKNGTQSGYDHKTGYWKDGNNNTVFADHVLIHLNVEPVSGKLTLRKVSDTANGIPLAGVEFTLYSDEGCADIVETACTGVNGTVEFDEKLTAGTYYLKETKALAGYETNDTVYRVRVHAGVATVTAVGGDGTAVHTVVNETSQTLMINKVNQSGKPVSGATFTLTRTGDYDEEEGRNDTPVYTSDEYGRITLDGLERGTYVLKETVAPNGYKPLEDDFEFVVANGEVFLPAGTAAPDGWKLTGTQKDGYFLTVTNQVLYVFPTTGGVGIYAPIALGAALMCMSAVLIIKRKRETA